MILIYAGKYPHFVTDTNEQPPLWPSIILNDFWLQNLSLTHTHTHTHTHSECSEDDSVYKTQIWFLIILAPPRSLSEHKIFKIRRTSSLWQWFLPWRSSEPLPWWSGSSCHWSLCAARSLSSSSHLLWRSSCYRRVNVFHICIWENLKEENWNGGYVCTWEIGVIEHRVGDVGSRADLGWHLENLSPHQWLAVVLRQSTCEGQESKEIQT